MNLPAKLLRYMLIVVIILLMILASTYLWYRAEIQQPYQTFLLQEQKAIPMFDALNEDVANTLPSLPDNSFLDAKWSVGISNPLYEHGRWMVIKVSTTKTQNSVLEYYGSYLLDNGWKENMAHHAFNDVFYYRGTSCIRISPPSDNFQIYEIEIWHDFRNQGFSPKIPDSKIMSWFELGMTNFAVCP